MIPFNYHHLYYFYVIAKEGSIAKATTKLSLAQPTLSAQLKQFERFLKTSLFIRDKKRLILSEEGRRVFAYATQIFDIGQEMKNRTVDLNTETHQRINIGVSYYVPKTIVEVLLNYILTINPNIFISLTKDRIEQLSTRLEDHQLDFILTDSPYMHGLRDNFDNHLLGKIPIVFCSHPSFAKTFKRFPQDLNNMPMFLPAAPRQMFYTIEEYLLDRKLKPRIIGEIEDIEIIRRLVLRGYGIAPLNLLTVKEAPAKQQLHILNAKNPINIFEKIYLISRTTKLRNSTIDRIKKEFKLNDYLTL